MKDKESISNDCRQATLVIEKLQCTMPDRQELTDLEMHLEGCSLCRLYAEQSQLISKLFAALSDADKRDPGILDSDTKDSMQKSINQHPKRYL